MKIFAEKRKPIGRRTSRTVFPPAEPLPVGAAATFTGTPETAARVMARLHAPTPHQAAAPEAPGPSPAATRVPADAPVQGFFLGLDDLWRRQRRHNPLMKPGLATLEAAGALGKKGLHETGEIFKDTGKMAGGSLKWGGRTAEKALKKGGEGGLDALTWGGRTAKKSFLGGLGLAGDIGKGGLEGAAKLGGGGLSLAGKALKGGWGGIKKAAGFAAAPGKWALGKARGADTWYKKLGYGALGFLGSLGTVPLGLIGMAGSGVLGAAGAAGASLAGGIGALGSAVGGGIGAVGAGLAGTVGAVGAGGLGLAGGVAAPLAGIAGAGLAGTAGLAGAATTGVLGTATGAITAGLTGVGTAVTGAVGTGLSALGGVGTGLWKGLKGAWKGIKSVPNLLGYYGPGAGHGVYGDRGQGDDAHGAFSGDGTRKNYTRDSPLDVFDYSAQGLSALSSAVKSGNEYITGGLEGHNPFSDKLSGWALNTPGARDLYGVAGAVGGGFSALSALVETYRGAKEAFASGNDTATRVQGGMQALSGLADATKSSATVAYNLGSLVNTHGAVATGAQIGMAGGAIALGAIDIIRGGYGLFKAGQREDLLRGIAGRTQDATVRETALTATGKQKVNQWEMGGKVLKGALTLGGGLLLTAAATSPIGWGLLGGAALVGGIAALVKWRKKKAHKREVAMRVLGVGAARDQWVQARDTMKGQTGMFSDARKNWYAQNQDPLEAALQQHGFKDVGHFYANYINRTANYLYVEGVNRYVPNAQNPQQVTELCGIIESMGLKLRTDKQPREPKPARIAKALG